MVFVKVVGGNEIYNFRIQNFVNFYTNFWSYSISKQCSAKQFVPGTLCAATSRRDAAPAPRCPCRVPPEAARRPRLAPPHALRPEAPWSPPGPRALWTAPYQHGARRGPPIHRRHPPYARRPRRPCHRRISRVTPPSSRLSHPYLSRVSCPPRAVPAAPPRLPLPAAGELTSPSFSSLLPRNPRSLSRHRCSALHLPRRSRSPPRPPSPTVAAHPRQSRPRSNPGLPRAQIEHVVVPHRHPGRERGRLAGIRPAPPPPMPKAPIA
jgi:hypothetical protein